MAQLKDSLITGDLRVTGTIYGNVPLNDLVDADDLKAIEALTGTSGLLKKTANNTWTLDTNAYTTSSGVTSVRVQATSPVVSSVNTAQSSSLNTTISLADGYGDTKNPYASKTKNYVLAASSSENSVPSFRALVAADIPSLSTDKLTSGTLGVARGGTGTSTAPTKGGIIYASSTSAYASTAAGSSGQYLKSAGSSAPEWASFVKPVVSWTAGTTNGPKLAVQATGGTSTAVAVPSASASASGIVTTDSQTFAGTKTFNGDSFYVQANEVRFKNKGNNNTAITNKPYSFRLNIGDGEYIHLSEYNDDDLEIHGSSILLTTTNYAIYNETAAYSAGNIVWYNGQYYRCTTAIASGGEAWTSSHWTALPMTAIMAANHINPWVTETYDLGSSSYKWNNLYAKKINGTAIASVTAQTTQAVYPIKINAIGQITAYGSAVTLGTLAGKSSIANHTYVKATGTSRSTDVTLDSTTVNSITAVGTLPSLTITSTTVVTGGSTTNIPNISKKTVVTDATAAKATYANGILSISDGSVTKGDSVGVGTAIAAYTSLTSGSVGSASDWSAGTLPTKGSNTTVATTVKTQPTFSITTENATLSHTIS